MHQQRQQSERQRAANARKKSEIAEVVSAAIRDADETKAVVLTAVISFTDGGFAMPGSNGTNHLLVKEAFMAAMSNAVLNENIHSFQFRLSVVDNKEEENNQIANDILRLKALKDMGQDVEDELQNLEGVAHNAHLAELD